jgi:hypothetical protein
MVVLSNPDSGELVFLHFAKAEFELIPVTDLAKDVGGCEVKSVFKADPVAFAGGNAWE